MAASGVQWTSLELICQLSGVTFFISDQEQFNILEARNISLVRQNSGRFTFLYCVTWCIVGYTCTTVPSSPFIYVVHIILEVLQFRFWIITQFCPMCEPHLSHSISNYSMVNNDVLFLDVYFLKFNLILFTNFWKVFLLSDIQLWRDICVEHKFLSLFQNIANNFEAQHTFHNQLFFLVCLIFQGVENIHHIFSTFMRPLCIFFTIQSFLPTAFTFLAIVLSRGIFHHCRTEVFMKNTIFSCMNNSFLQVSIMCTLLLDISFQTS